MGATFESPLSDAGRTIAQHKGKLLRAEKFRPVTVYTSTLSRAMETAELIVKELGVTPNFITLAGLNERNFGKYEGKPYKEVLDAFEREGEDPDTIEPVEAFVTRVLSAWEQVIHAVEGTTLVVTHSNPEMVMQAVCTQPEMLQTFWELGDPAYCEGFTWNLQN